jgi:hypothetical protein
MIKCVFTVDYEVYGDGTGSLAELAYEPTERLRDLFADAGSRFVLFPDVAELEIIEAADADAAMPRVADQIRCLYDEGFEIGLHLHPGWYNASQASRAWSLDYSEYNLCALAEDRIAEIVDRGIRYLRRLLGQPTFTPLSFRAGHLIFQPTQPLARVLDMRGVRLDSSVYKGGRWSEHHLDYRRALRNGYFWRFGDQIDVPSARGDLFEIPIYTDMVPVWRLLTAKRIGLQRSGLLPRRGRRTLLSRLSSCIRRQPLKLDFCHMTMREITRVFSKILEEDRCDPMSRRPVVAIGHTKDLIDLHTVDALLTYLQANRIDVVTFSNILGWCDEHVAHREGRAG